MSEIYARILKALSFVKGVHPALPASPAPPDDTFPAFANCHAIDGAAMGTAGGPGKARDRGCFITLEFDGALFSSAGVSVALLEAGLRYYTVGGSGAFPVYDSASFAPTSRYVVYVWTDVPLRDAWAPGEWAPGMGS